MRFRFDSFIAQLRSGVFTANRTITLPDKSGAIALDVDILSRQTFSNVNVTVSAATTQLAQTGTLTAPRTVTLPLANSKTSGFRIDIVGESGTSSPTNKIILARSGSDLINGLTTLDAITFPNGAVYCVSDGVSRWSVFFSDNNASVSANFASPPAIGNVTPDTGAFTAITGTTFNNARVTTSLGFAITTSAPPSTGTDWLAIGRDAGLSNTSGNNWNAFGRNAGRLNVTGSNWIAIGRNAGELCTGGNWTAIGNAAGSVNTVGEFLALGASAGQNNASGSGWLSIGTDSGRGNTTGSNWTAIGTRAGIGNTTGSNWIAIGNNAATGNTTGIDWIGIGSDAGRDNSSGASWTAIGTGAGAFNLTGSNWVAIGASAGRSNSSGSDWVAIGTDAGRSSATGSRNVFIGRSAGFNETGSDKLYIDVTATANPLIWGDFSTRVLRSNGRLQATVMQPDAYTTGTLPSASANPRGIAYNSTLNKLVMSNGTTWETITST